MTDLNQGEVKSSEAASRPTTIRTERSHILALNKCCFCVSLRTGCLVIAYLYLLITLANFVLALVSVFSIVMFLVKEYVEPQLLPLLVYDFVKLLLLMAALPCNVLLLIGLHKEKHNLVKIFIIFQMAFLVLYVLVFVSFASAGYLTGDWLLISGESIAIAVGVYHLLVMWSQYVKMCENKRRQGQMYLEARLVNTPAA